MDISYRGQGPRNPSGTKKKSEIIFRMYGGSATIPKISVLRCKTSYRSADPCTDTMNLTPQAVFLEHENWLRTVVRSRVQENEAVEDIMQNIALALVRHRDTLKEIGQLGAWLYQVAVRQVMMYRRTAGRRRNFNNRLLRQADSVSIELADPVASVVAAEKREAVQDAVAQLDEIDRQVLMLKYVEGWTYRQLAEMLGVTEDTIEYRLLKARKRLKVLLKSSVETT